MDVALVGNCFVVLLPFLQVLCCPDNIYRVGEFSQFYHTDLKPCSATFWLTFQSALQAGFTSLAHTDADVEHTIQAARETFAEI